MFFFFNDTATTEIYTLSLHDALPISRPPRSGTGRGAPRRTAAWVSPPRCVPPGGRPFAPPCLCPWHQDTGRSEEHTSELQSRQYLVCRLLLEKKKNKIKRNKSIKIKL